MNSYLSGNISALLLGDLLGNVLALLPGHVLAFLLGNLLWDILALLTRNLLGNLKIKTGKVSVKLLMLS